MSCEINEYSSHDFNIVSKGDCDPCPRDTVLEVKDSAFVTDLQAFYAPTRLYFPASSVQSPKDGAILIELYKDATVYWKYRYGDDT